MRRTLLTRAPIVLLAALSTAVPALAQTLRAQPWPPPASGEFDLGGSGFEPGAQVRLRFGAPAPTAPGGQPAPAVLLADTEGSFLLPLRAAGPISVTAESGTRSAQLDLAARIGPELPPAEPAMPPNLRLESGAIEARRGGVLVWRAVLTDPRTPVVIVGQRAYAGEGTSVTGRDLETGRVTGRAFLSGPVAAIEADGRDLRATTEPLDGVREAFTILTSERGLRVRERVTFPPQPELLASLEGAADDDGATGPMSEPQARARRLADPTNPFLALRHGAALDRERQAQAAVEAYRAAIATPAPFYVRVRLAALLEGLRQPALADAALEAARAAWADAGYDPGFQVGPEALSAWGAPAAVARRLFARGDAVRGEAWLRFLRGTMPRFDGHDRTYVEYAAWLDAQGRRGEADDWRAFAADLDRRTPFGLGGPSLERLSAGALATLLAILLAFGGLWLVLKTKYWPAQGRDLASLGGRWRSIARAPIVRLRHASTAYWTLTEKLVGLTLVVLAIGATVLWSWSLRGSAALGAPELNAGTVGGAAYWARAPMAGDDNRAQALVRGLALQLDEDLAGAAAAYEAAGDACALNNLGVVQADRADAASARASYERALTLDPEQDAAAYNLGSDSSGPRAAFHASFRPGRPMLCVPGPGRLLESRVGWPRDELARLASDPWSYLAGLPLRLAPVGRAVVAIVAIVLTLAAFGWLLVPRPRSARTASRPATYRLLALLVPGTALADEVWGLLLLLPWAALVAALAAVLMGPAVSPALLSPTSPLGLVLVPPPIDLAMLAPGLWVALAVVYAINAVGWALELAAERRRRTPAN